MHTSGTRAYSHGLILKFCLAKYYRIHAYEYKTCINIIISMLFYTNCTCGLEKNELRLLKGSENFFDWGGLHGSPLNTPMDYTCIIQVVNRLVNGARLSKCYRAINL